MSIKQILSTLLIIVLVFCATACGSAEKPQFDGTIDILLPYAQKNRIEKIIPETLKKIAALYTKKSGVAFNFIELDANTIDDYNKKRIALLIGDDAPEIVVFAPNDAHWHQQFLALSRELIDVSQLIENYDDIITALRFKHAIPVAMIKAASSECVKPGDDFELPAVLAYSDLKPIMEEWAKSPDARLTFPDLGIYVQSCYSGLIQEEGYFGAENESRMVDGVVQLSHFLDYFIARDGYDYDTMRQRVLDGESKYFKEDITYYHKNPESRPLNGIDIRVDVLDVKNYESKFTSRKQPVVVTDSYLYAFFLAGFVKKAGGVSEVEDFLRFVVSRDAQLAMQKFYFKNVLKLRSPILKSIYLENLDIAESQRVKPSTLNMRRDLILALDNEAAKQHFITQSLNGEAFMTMLKLALDYSYNEIDERGIAHEVHKFIERLNLSSSE